MKWQENNIFFEGTVEEFMALHRPAVVEREAKALPAPVEPPQRRERAGLPVEATLRGGEALYLRSIAAAFRWYVNDQGDSRSIRTSAEFRRKLIEEKAIYAGGTIFALASSPVEAEEGAHHE